MTDSSSCARSSPARPRLGLFVRSLSIRRTRPKPRQYTIADLERARDRVAAAERRIDNDRTNNANRGRAGLERAQLELSVIESQLRLRGLLGSTAIKPE